jgi:hypothetical protein
MEPPGPAFVRTISIDLPPLINAAVGGTLACRIITVIGVSRNVAFA